MRMRAQNIYHAASGKESWARVGQADLARCSTCPMSEVLPQPDGGNYREAEDGETSVLMQFLIHRPEN